MITSQQLIVATNCSEVNAEKYLSAINLTLERYGIGTKKTTAAFLSQIAHESSSLNTIVENLNYRVAALTSLFGRQRISDEQAKMFGRDDTIKQPANQEAIANIIYGGDWGRRNLGNTDEGDGWKFRGRGLKQVTGRSNYDRCGKALDIDLVSNPDELLNPIYAALSAGWFWDSRRRNGIEEAAESDDVETVTKLINGGLLGIEQRKDLYYKALEVLE
jgi:putative chitinase